MKIFAKIVNDKLIIKWAAGFMNIEEFLSTYGREEQDRGSPVRGTASPNKERPDKDNGTTPKKGTPAKNDFWMNVLKNAMNDNEQVFN